MKKRKSRILLITVLTLLLLGIAFCLWVSAVYSASPEAAALLQGSDAVKVEPFDKGWRLDGPGEGSALIFYPGGKVEPTAYLPLLMALAEDGIDCFLVKMPLDLAVFDINAAASVQDAWTYARWYIGGHSLGGACAALYAAENGDRLTGLILLAAYATRPLNEGLSVLELHGSEDGVLNRKKLEAGRQYLPPSAVSRELPGGNHAQFGAYGVQRGDGTASLSPAAQLAWTVDGIEEMILAEK